MVVPQQPRGQLSAMQVSRMLDLQRPTVAADSPAATDAGDASCADLTATDHAPAAVGAGVL